MTASIKLLVIPLSLFLTLAACKQTGSGSVKAAAGGEVISNPAQLRCDKLDAGLFWYGKGNVAERAAGDHLSFYDPTRPTVIYFHGWQANALATKQRETYHFDSVERSSGDDMAAAWIDAGWNIGIFDWTQFAADTLFAAEAKIWEAPSGGTLTWTDCSGTASSEGITAGQSVGDLATAAIAAALSDFQGKELRLVGHSLGSQLAANVAGLLSAKAQGSEAMAMLKPTRVAQLDPYWNRAQGTKPSRAGAVTSIVEATKAQGTLWELYRTSMAVGMAADPNTALTASIGQLSYNPSIWGSFFPPIDKQHNYARRVYFMALAEPGVHGCDAANPQAACPSAAMSDADLAKFMTAAKVYAQKDGMLTESLADDVFAPQLTNTAATSDRTQ